jgi:hypothetical protein
LCFGAFSFEFARRALGQQPQRVYNYWGARTLGAEFRRRLEDFKVDQVNALPLLHTSISRGRFVESHQYFSGQTDGNYFEYVGQALADRLLEHSADLPIWIE